ncbi:hypothetical protein ACH0B5_15405 [Ureibacillus sp. 179-F W5.1 NHS]|uniref:hypothetical protein n=1 Tax=Ureibacillus sp. 179-F W5.1 NHS TaxID=3374297 RepID=UPI003879C3FB
MIGKRKLPVVELFDVEVKEENGEFFEEKTNKERFPLFFNNHSLKVGREYGILEKALESELLEMISAMGIEAATKGELSAAEVVLVKDKLDKDHMKNVIYLGYVGPRNDFYDLETFKNKYNADFEEVLDTYLNLLMYNFSKDTNNNFKKALEQATEKQKGKK